MDDEPGFSRHFQNVPSAESTECYYKHLQIVGATEFLAIIVGIPIGFLSTRRAFRFISMILIGIANVGQTVPTLAFIDRKSVV